MVRDETALHGIANKVHDLVEDSAKMQRFREQYRKFRAKEKKNPNILELLTLPYKLSPLTIFICEPKSAKYTDALKLMACYVLLTIIHDKALTALTTPKIIDDIDDIEERWFEDRWVSVQYDFFNNPEDHITPAFECVEKDLKKISLTSENKTEKDEKKPEIISLTEKEMKVLSYLGQKPTLEQCQADIESGTQYSRKTIGGYLNRLMLLGLVEHPKDKKQRYKIIQKGLDFLSTEKKTK